MSKPIFDKLNALEQIIETGKQELLTDPIRMVAHSDTNELDQFVWDYKISFDGTWTDYQPFNGIGGRFRGVYRTSTELEIIGRSEPGFAMHRHTHQSKEELEAVSGWCYLIIDGVVHLVKETERITVPSGVGHAWICPVDFVFRLRWTLE